MTHHRFFRTVLSLGAAAVAMLAIPAGAGATILVGMESNRELVNTTQTPALQAKALDLMKEQGVQVVRANYRWYDAAENCGGQTAKALENFENPCYSWTRFDGIVKQANDRGLQVLISISQNPAWLHPQNAKDRLFMGVNDTQFSRTIEHYAAFHKAAGTRYRQGSPFGFVKYWTIHNEPNSRVYWAPAPNAARYAQLYARTAVVLKTASPGSLIAPGPTGPTGGTGGIKPRKFLQDFQKHVVKFLPGAMASKRRYINAYAHNPYPGATTAPNLFKANVMHPDAITMGSIDRLYKQLDAAPITRGAKVWATEFGWETNDRLYKVSLNTQQVFMAEAFDWLSSKGRVQIGISYNMTDPPASDAGDWTSGTIMNNGIRKPSFKMFQRMISVPAVGVDNVIARNSPVMVWGRSNVKPAGAKIAFKAPGDIWRTVPGQRPDANKSLRATIRLTKRGTYQFAVYDGTYGPTRSFSVR